MLEEHLEKLRAFYFTARSGSFVQASKELNITQPAVTKSVKILESHIRTVLFIRHRRGVSLTKSGTMLNEFCESLFAKIKDLEQKIETGKSLSGFLRIATYETLGDSFWPKALKQMASKLPDLVVELTTEDPQNNWHKLESGIVDLIVDAEPIIADRFFSKVLYTDRFGLFVKRDSKSFHPHTNLPLSYVKRAVDRKGLSVDFRLTKLLKNFDLRYSVESFVMTRSLVIEGLCIGVLPLRLASPLVKKGTITPYILSSNKHEFGEHRICMTCPYDLRKDPRIVSIGNLLSAAANQP